MGGLFAVEYLSTRKVDRKFDSVILSAPAFGLTRKPFKAKVLHFNIFTGCHRQNSQLHVSQNDYRQWLRL